MTEDYEDVDREYPVFRPSLWGMLLLLYAAAHVVNRLYELRQRIKRRLS